MYEKKKKRKEKNLHFASALFSKDMLRIVKGFAPWILFDCFEEKFLYHWSAGRSPRVHEVNLGRDPSQRFDKAMICERGRHVALSNFFFFVKVFCIKGFF